MFSGRKRASYRCYREIGTTQERRANQDGWCRAARRPHVLPNAWDDITRRDMDDRSWKRYRGHQWKSK